MLGCVALAVDAIVQNTQIMNAVVFSQPFHGLSLGALFITGCVVGLLFALGLSLFIGGLSRSWAIRRERRALRNDVGGTATQRERNAMLEAELANPDAATYPSE